MTDLGSVQVDGKRLRLGYTTGSSAAGAAKAAALLFLTKVLPENIEIKLPGGASLSLKVGGGELIPTGSRCWVVKDGGDDPDVTNGLEIIAEVIPHKNNSGITFFAGSGVGVVTKPGLQIPVGEPAINPIPRQMITEALYDVLPVGWGAQITISVSGGKEAAVKTLNPKLGIVGGISILGTTGIVHPMSEEAYKASLLPQIEQAKLAGLSSIILVPGRIGGRHAAKIFTAPPEAIAEMSNFVGFMLMECAARKIKEVIILGHISKLVKVAAGVFHTHNRVADARMETLAAICALHGMETENIRELLDNVTVEGALELIKGCNLDSVFVDIASRVSKRASEHTCGALKVGTVLLNMPGEILAMDDNAREIASNQGWSIRCESI